MLKKTHKVKLQFLGLNKAEILVGKKIIPKNYI